MKKALVATCTAGFLIASLAACSSQSNSIDPNCPVTASGSSSAKVKVTGAAGEEPKVEFPTPLQSSSTERSVISEGNGEVVEPGMQVSLNYALYSGATGKKLDSSPDFGSKGALTFVVDESKVMAGMAKLTKCSTVGSRIVGVIPPQDGFGDAGPNFGIGATESLVFVFDIKDASAAPTSSPSPDLTELPIPKEWKENLPTVDLSGSEPVVALPSTSAPTELELAVLTPGDGAEVSQTSNVTIDYQGISWDTGKIFDQSYTRGQPSTFPVSGVIPGFAAAMIGQKVGATLLVVIPPKFGYGEGEINEQNLVGQTLVFVIQIHNVS